MLGFPDIRNYAILALAAVCVTLGLTTCEYRRQFKAAEYALEVQNKAIAAQKEAANRQLLIMTKQRDLIYEQQEKIDREAKDRISTLQRQLSAAVIRVRLNPQPRAAGCGGGSAEGKDAKAGAGNSSETHGVLPERNSRRLKQVIAEMEQTNAAYASCRAALLGKE